MPVNPDAKHSHQPRTLRVRQCAAIAVCRLPPSKTPASSAQPAIAASDALAQPQEGHAQANAAGVRPSPVAAEDGVAGFGSGLPSIPAIRPLLSRRRRIVTPKVSPQEPPTADRRHPVTTFPHAVFAPLTCLQSRPPARLFSFETAHRAATPSAPLGSPRCGSVEGLYSPDNTSNNQTHIPKDRPDPHPHRPTPRPGASRLPSHRPGAFTPRCTGRATARARCHARCWALRSPHAPAFGLVSVTFRPEARKEVGASGRKVLFCFNSLAIGGHSAIVYGIC